MGFQLRAEQFQLVRSLAVVRPAGRTAPRAIVATGQICWRPVCVRVCVCKLAAAQLWTRPPARSPARSLADSLLLNPGFVSLIYQASARAASSSRSLSIAVVVLALETC